MRIISSFKDYYDCMAKYDDDHATLFLREEMKPVEVPFDLSSLVSGLSMINPRFYLRSDPAFSHKGVVIVFAGQFYPLIEEYRYSFKNGSSTSFIFDKDEAIRREVEASKGERGSYKNRIDEFFKFFADSSKPVFRGLVESFGPVFVIHMSHMNGHGNPEAGHVWIERNARLLPYGFVKVLPPPIAYNELKKFVCNTANPARPIPEMSNDIKIHQAGFNLKTSFRRAKSK